MTDAVGRLTLLAAGPYLLSVAALVCTDLSVLSTRHVTTLSTGVVASLSTLCAKGLTVLNLNGCCTFVTAEVHTLITGLTIKLLLHHIFIFEDFTFIH